MLMAKDVVHNMDDGELYTASKASKQLQHGEAGKTSYAKKWPDDDVAGELLRSFFQLVNI